MSKHTINLRTYGRHKQRTIHADVWSSEADKDKNVFSLSSNSSDSTLNSTKDTSVSDTSKHNNGHQSKNRPRRTVCYGKENKQLRPGLRRVAAVNYFPSSDSQSEKSSTEKNGNKRVIRRALRDRNDIKKQQNTQTLKSFNLSDKPVRMTMKEMKQNLQDSSSVPNFSEFDDYSLLISTESPKEKQVCNAEHSYINGKRKRLVRSKCKHGTTFSINPTCDCDNVSSLISGNVDISDSASLNRNSFLQLQDNPVIQVETSTPFAKRTRQTVVDIKESEISYIEPVSIILTPDSFRSTNRSCLGLTGDQQNNSSRTEISSLNVRHSPFIPKSDYINNLQRKSSGSCEKIASPSQCLVQLDKLRESFLMMHINGRKHSSENEKRKKHSSDDDSVLDPPEQIVLDNSESLFSSDTSYASNSSDEIEIDDLSEIQEEEDECSSSGSDEKEDGPSSNESDENTGESTKYELVEDYQDDLLNDESGGSVQKSSRCSSKSNYCTAESDDPSVDMSSFHTAEQSVNNSDLNQSSKSPIQADMSDRRPIISLENSFRVLLTPIKINKVIPQSPHSKVLDVCDQSSPFSFKNAFGDMMAHCVKIGEGVYGEVFRTQNSGSVALKIIPIEGNFTVNDEPQKTYAEILPEIIISKELSSLRCHKVSRTDNFCEVKQVSCIQGKYPPKLLQEWDLYHKEKESENDRPNVFGPEQLYIMFEFADGGKDLESCKFSSIFQSYHVIKQVIFSLAVAEEALQFEHRDLHWGNVLVRKTDKKLITYDLLGTNFEIDSGKLEVSIIDFTLSRLRKDGCTVFCDLAADESLFQGEGDYQFDIYRKMQEENGNKWEPFNPHTNVLWIHYLADKLVRSKRYSSNTREDKNLLRDFRQFLKDALNYSSACDIVLNCHFINSDI